MNRLAVMSLFLLGIAALLIGWILNIVNIVKADWSAGIGVEIILRIVGLIFAPFGGVIGWF